MSILISALTQNAPKSENIRPIAKFHPHPSIWGDQFLNYNIDKGAHSQAQKKIEELKEVVRGEIFTSTVHDPSHQLKLIDAIERLGLSYHFEKELEEALQLLYTTYNNHHEEDLVDVALRFRLLRQNGYYVSCDKFHIFKDESGNFKAHLVNDVPGLLSLYEAAHFGLHGEDILDEALVFATTQLKSMVTQMSNNNPLAPHIKSALNQPLRKCLERLQTKRYISIYQNEISHNKALLEFAKLDFNLVQSIHRKEISDISKWWKEIDVPRRFPFARDRIVELYFWILGLYFEPQYLRARKFLTKIIGLTSIMDDIYDAFATFEELVQFTEAIERWDVNCIDQLPEFMQRWYIELLNVFEEFENELGEENKYRFHHAKKSMKILARAYFDEARWCNQGYTPSVEEYMNVATLSGANFMLAIVSFVGMGDIVTEEAFEWIFNRPKILTASEIISRYMDDMASHKFEHERMHVATAVECYVKQYGASEQEAYKEFNQQVMNAWKDINKEFLRPTAMPMPLLKCVGNFVRVVDFLYKEDDGYTRVGKKTKDGITAVLIDPVVPF